MMRIRIARLALPARVFVAEECGTARGFAALDRVWFER
jgi:hypothetical protein